MRLRAGRAGFVALAALAALCVAAPAARAAPVRCTSGTPMFAHGSLRILGVAVHYPSDANWRGSEQYACTSARGRPLAVGSAGSGEGTASAAVTRYLYDGARYLATEQYSDGEGGPDTVVRVRDLRTRHTVTFWAGTGYPPDESPPLRMTTRGELLSADGDVVLVPRGLDARPRELWKATPAAQAGDVALVGTTVYWTQRPVSPGAAAPVAGSATIAGDPAAPEVRLLEPVAVRPDRGRCATRRGTTIERSPRVRVLARRGRRSACRAGSDAVVRLPGGTLRDVRIAGDRHVLVAGASELTVTDMSTRVRRSLGPATAWTILANGTVAWIAPDGTLRMQRLRATAPVVLAAAASALASSGRSIYWTAGGVAQRAAG